MKKNSFTLLMILLLVSQAAFALEPDQYRMWRVGLDLIPDSTETTNAFLDEKLSEYLEKQKCQVYETPEVKTCFEMAHGFMKFIRPHFFKDKLKTHLIKDEPGLAYPQKQKLFKDYKDSIFKGWAWPFLMPVAQTVKINGVYLGTDKLDHFFSSGRRYLNSYKRGLEDALSEEQALMRALDYGVAWAEESGFLGTWTAGSFSYADLEANYQGLQLGLDLCQGLHPILRYDYGVGWQQARAIKIEDYVNPLWDESFNNSFYIKSRYKKIKKNVQSEICDLAQSEDVKNLWDDYHKRLAAEPTSFHLEYLRGLMIIKEIPNPTSQSIEQMCEFEPGTLPGPKIWKLPLIHTQELSQEIQEDQEDLLSEEIMQ